MKFEINSKDLSNAIDRVKAVVPKNAAFTCITCLYFSPSKYGIKIKGTDLDRFLSVDVPACVYDYMGEFGILLDDIKPFVKSKGDILVESIEESRGIKIAIRSGSKIITVNGYNIEDRPKWPDIQKRELIAELPETWFRESIEKIGIYTSGLDKGKVMSSINVNTEEKYLEALDGHRVARREITGLYITKPVNDFLISKGTINAFKKILSKKGSQKICLYDSEKYIVIYGDSFEYIQRKIEGKYFNVSQIMNVRDFRFGFDIQTEDLYEKMKDIKDLYVPTDKKAVVITLEGNKIQTNYQDTKYRIEDKIDIENGFGDVTIGFNPLFMMDACSTIDSDIMTCKGMTRRDPLFIDADDYHLMILPVHI